MSKFLFTADFHLTTRPCDSYRWQIFQWLMTQVVNRGVTDVFVLGDLTDQKDHHPSKLVRRIIDQLSELSQECSIWIMMGNHDYVDPEVPFFGFLDVTPLSDESNIYFIGEPEAIDIGNHPFLFLPHSKSWRRDWKKFDFSAYDFILLHQSVEGAKTPTGHALQGVPPSIFSEDKTNAIVIAGDVHVPQSVGNVTYVGSPHPICFGDDFQPRVLFWDGELKSIKRTTTKKMSLKISSTDEINDENITEGDQVRVTMTLPRSEFSDWDEYKRKIKEMIESRGAVLSGMELREKPKRVRIGDKKALSMSTPTSPADVIQRFCDVKKIDEALARVGKEYVR